MRINFARTAGLLVLLSACAPMVGCGSGPSTTPESGKQAPDIELVLVLESPMAFWTDPLKFHAALRNRGSSTVFVGLALGHDIWSKTIPYVNFEIRGPDHNLIVPDYSELILETPSGNDVRAVTLPPGATTELFECENSIPACIRSWRPVYLGSYEVRLTYDTTIPEGSWGGSGSGEERDDVPRLREHGLRCRLESDWVRFEFVGGPPGSDK